MSETKTAFLFYSDIHSLSTALPNLDSAQDFIDKLWGKGCVLVTGFPTTKVYRDLDAAIKESQGDKYARPVATLKHVEGYDAEFLLDNGVSFHKESDWR